MTDCYNCDENESMDDGVLCDECREAMWEGERTHHGRLRNMQEGEHLQ